ncbi:MAG: tRNA-specific adenosine deaminase [Desulfobacteraceae bacterium 4484_190.2]|nr:MAG: tRNA-specific adenosine deaminase [Desulfobacteraceae bacterium 4484_190.2]
MPLDLFHLMKQALSEAEKGSSMGEVPVGAVLASPEGRIVAKAYNQPIALGDPTAHAEILAIRKAGLFFRNYRLNNTTLVVTLEPCLMCMGAAINARIARLVFGTVDPKAGAAVSLYNLAEDKRLNHRIEVVSGIMEGECRSLIQNFFRIRRRKPLPQVMVP